jgi:hypothetical protein
LIIDHHEEIHYEQTNSYEHSLISKGLDPDMFNNKSEEEKTPRGVIREFRVQKTAQQHFAEHPKSLFFDDNQHDDSLRMPTPLAEQVILMDNMERDDSPPHRINMKEPLVKKTGRFEESVYDKNDISQKAENIQKYLDDDITPISTNDVFFNPQILNFESKISQKQTSESIPKLEKSEMIKDSFKKTTTHNFQDFNKLDFFDFHQYDKQEDKETEDQNLYLQQSIKMKDNNEQSGIFEEEKLLQEPDYRVQINERDVPRIRGGAVTQGFMNMDRRKKNNDQRRQPSEPEQRFRSSQQTPNNLNFMPMPAPFYGRSDQFYRPLPYAYQNQMQNENAAPKEDHESVKNVRFSEYPNFNFYSKLILAKSRVNQLPCTPLPSQ